MPESVHTICDGCRGINLGLHVCPGRLQPVAGEVPKLRAQLADAKERHAQLAEEVGRRKGLSSEAAAELARAIRSETT